MEDRKEKLKIYFLMLFLFCLYLFAHYFSANLYAFNYYETAESITDIIKNQNLWPFVYYTTFIIILTIVAALMNLLSIVKFDKKFSSLEPTGNNFTASFALLFFSITIALTAIIMARVAFTPLIKSRAYILLLWPFSLFCLLIICRRELQYYVIPEGCVFYYKNKRRLAGDVIKIKGQEIDTLVEIK